MAFEFAPRQVDGLRWAAPDAEDLQSLQCMPSALPESSDALAKAEHFRCSMDLGPYTWSLFVHAVRTPGAQRVALCMHGHGTNCNWACWARMWPALLEKGFHVLAFDCPGYGRSSGTTNQTTKWKQYDQDLALRLLQGWGVPMDGGCVTVFGQCMGGAMFLRALQKCPSCFAPFHILHNCTIGTWPDKLGNLLTAMGGGLFVFWEADDDHRRDSNVYREFSRLASSSPNLCKFEDLNGEKPRFPILSDGVLCPGSSRDGTPGSEVPGTGSMVYILTPSAACLEAIASFVSKNPRSRGVKSRAPVETALQRGAPSKGFRVFVRIRPPVEREAGEKENVSTAALENWEPPAAWEGPPPDQLVVHNRGEWIFDRVFKQMSSQDEVYAAVAQPLVAAVLAGHSACLFAYGQTGSGKTYTIQGEAMDGVMPCALRDLCSNISPHEMIFVTYIQLYNDILLDLFEPGTQKLSVQDDGKGGAIVTGAHVYVPQSISELFERVERGAQLRATGQTDMNDASSRSHAILSLSLGAGGDARVFHIVDLAGSERVKRSGATGDRLEEAIAINSSLLALGNVVSALVENDGKPRGHIPYRDSLLTRLLRSALGGSARTALVACISPTEDSQDETVSTLHFAARATHIRNQDEKSDDELPPAEMAKLEQNASLPPIDASGKTKIMACDIEVSCYADWAGSGPLFVFLHYYGFGGSAIMWCTYFDEIRAAGARYLAPDMPGHGDTSGTSSSRPEDFSKPGGPIDIIKALLDAIGEPKAIFVGFDWGGGIAAEFAIAYPKRVSKLAFWCMSYRDETKLAKLSNRGKQILFFWDKNDPNRSPKKGQTFAKIMKTRYREFDRSVLVERMQKWAQP